jgi:hypothetical protein
MRPPKAYPLHMPAGPSLIFDKSALESLNLDEAVLLDNFYMSNITPLFFVECLADLEKFMRSRSTPEQLVGSLADRTPDMQSTPNVHYMTILTGELSRQFDIRNALGRVLRAGGEPVQLGDQKGMIFRRSPEAEALERWTKREFLEIERNIAKEWRQMLIRIDFDAMVKSVMIELGHWRKPKTLEDARLLTDIIIDNMDPEWLIGFGLALLGIPEATEHVRNDWIARRRPPLREHVPYFIFMLTINIFFCLVLPTQLLRNVKPSHQVDLAYLYYLPFCDVFTSKDNFHAQVVPLFLNTRPLPDGVAGPQQTFINGTELKDDLRKLDEYYSSQPDHVKAQGLFNFGLWPPEDGDFLTTRLWDMYLPRWRDIKHRKDKPNLSDPDYQKRTLDELKQLSDSPDLQSHDEYDIDKLNYVTVQRMVKARKGKWRRFSKDQEARMLEEKWEPPDFQPS